MTTVSNFERGGYRFLPSVFQYSAGVAALPGYQIQRVRFGYPVPLADGFNFIERFIQSAGRPPTALCACELRPECMQKLAARSSLLTRIYSRFLPGQRKRSRLTWRLSTEQGHCSFKKKLAASRWANRQISSCGI